MINVYQPSLGEEELNRIREVFASNWLGKGKLTAEFESEFAEHVKSDKSLLLSTNCCTEGLFSSMQLCDIGEEDEVILPTVSFVGAANAICANKSRMVLCDVDPRTLNARAEDIEKVITPKSKAILLLHYGGIPCEMDDIMELAARNDIKVIEDCAAGVCSSYKGKALGTFGDIGMWSFDAMKILVSADGAMLHFRDKELRNRAEKLLYFGLETKSGYENSVAQKWWEFDISCYGHRAIMNDVTAAMALEQLKKLPEFMNRRKKVHEYYDANLKDLKWIDIPPRLPEYIKTSYYFYHIQVRNGLRDQLAAYLRERGVYTTYRYFPLHRVKGYNVVGDFPNADFATDNTLCLPIHQSLSESDIELVVELIAEFGREFAE